MSTAPPPTSLPSRDRAATIVLWTSLAVSTVIRVGHVAYQPAADPSFSHPGLDAQYYLVWARALASGSGGPSGAYYLAPLYPRVLAAWLGTFGEHAQAWLLAQHVAATASALFLASIARASAGRLAGALAAALFLLYQPTVFFASRVLSESVAILLLCAGVWLLGRNGTRSALAGGAVLSLAGLAKPYLLLVPALWIAWEVLGKSWRRALYVAASAAVVVAPTTVRNLVVSGHPVLVSSNGGITLYHGNGPGSLGIYNPPTGFSGALLTQRDEARELAQLRSGRVLDEVEADHWWGGEAIRTRLADPGGTAVLLLRRLALTLDDYEHGLDDPPALDPNPWACLWSVPGTVRAGGLPRRISWVPFGLIFGLAAASMTLRGVRGSGGWRLWGAIGACAVTPLVFYVSSRYRLPMVALLVVPAGIGAATLVQGVVAGTRRRAGWIVLCACAAASFFVPFGGLRAAEEAGALTNRAVSYQQAGNPAAAERVARQALAIDRESTAARFVLGVLLERSGRDAEAEAQYRAVVAMDPGHAEAAGNLGGLLTRSGRPGEAVTLLRAALAARPGHRACTTNLVVALSAAGDAAEARRVLADALRRGIPIDPELVRLVNGS